jgi:hypothetical protein
VRLIEDHTKYEHHIKDERFRCFLLQLGHSVGFAGCRTECYRFCARRFISDWAEHTRGVQNSYQARTFEKVVAVDSLNESAQAPRRPAGQPGGLGWFVPLAGRITELGFLGRTARHFADL